MHRVSVIIPTYNYGKYIEKAIDSVLAQTYKDFEIIVVDDGSTDNTKELIETKYRNRIRYFYQENKGAPVARNRGVEESSGQYLAFLDADDIFYPENLGKKVSLLDKREADGFVYSDGYCVNDDTRNKVKCSHWKHNAAYAKLSGDIFLRLLEDFRLQTCAAIIRRQCVLDVNGFDENLHCLQDHDLFLRISARNTCSFIDECLFEYLGHTGSLSQSTSKLNTYRSKSLIIRKIEREHVQKALLLGTGWKKLRAAAYFFDGTIAYDMKNHRTACKHYISSITTYPLQKRVYLSLFMAILKSLYQRLL